LTFELLPAVVMGISVTKTLQDPFYFVFLEFLGHPLCLTLFFLTGRRPTCVSLSLWAPAGVDAKVTNAQSQSGGENEEENEWSVAQSSPADTLEFYM
jgi:hypothetical protein